MKIASAVIENYAASHYAKNESESISIRFQKTADAGHSSAPSRERSPDVVMDEESLDPKLRAIIDILEHLTGQKIKIRTFHAHESSSVPSAAVRSDQNKSVGWGLEINTSYSMHEEQSLAFRSSGRIVTEDGREIDFSLNLQFNREFTVYESTTLRAGDKLSDPLIISLDGSSPIGDGKFSFDLIKGGKMESIPYLASNNGFLTLDKNNDGKINDGSELFGPQTGNGFNELISYDQDRNGWIDENDPIFRSLKLWIKTAEDDYTLTLKEAGIGALSLNPAKGSFDFKDESNTTIARLQQTSVAISESGEAKPLFGLDLAV